MDTGTVTQRLHRHHLLNLTGGSARCECGWESKPTTENRAHAGWLTHMRKAIRRDRRSA